MTTTVKNDKSKDFFKKLDQVKKGYVTIGVHEDAGGYDNGVPVWKVALANEFGAHIENGFGKGIEINIPERSFIRSAIDDNIDKINKWREEMLENIFDKNWTVEKALKAIGLRIQILIQNKIKSHVPPPNADSTLAEKKREGQGQVTLVASGTMLRSVTFKVVGI